MWEDERERRKLLNITDPLTPPGSPPRPSSAYDSSESEKFWLERFDKMLEEKIKREEHLNNDNVVVRCTNELLSVIIIFRVKVRLS